MMTVFGTDVDVLEPDDTLSQVISCPSVEAIPQTLTHRLTSAAVSADVAWVWLITEQNWTHGDLEPRLIDTIETGQNTLYPPVHFKCPLPRARLQSAADVAQVYRELLTLHPSELVLVVAVPARHPGRTGEALERLAVAITPLLAATPTELPADLVDALIGHRHATHSQRLLVAQLSRRYHAIHADWPRPISPAPKTARDVITQLETAIASAPTHYR